MSSGLQSAEVSNPASTVPGSTESANTHCLANGVVNMLSTAPIISIVDANTRMPHHLALCHYNDPTLATASLRRVAHWRVARRRRRRDRNVSRYQAMATAANSAARL